MPPESPAVPEERRMETWPEFVRDVEERQSCLFHIKGQARSPVLHMTGWETVVFQLEDSPDSDFSTAAIAP